MTEPNATHRPTTDAEPLPPLAGGEFLDRATFHARYAAMPPSFRAELVGGRVFVSSPVHLAHSEFHCDVMGWLWAYRIATPGTRSLDNPTVFLDDDNEPQPDAVLFIDPDRGGRAKIEANVLVGAPELVVEIADSSVRFDLKAKRMEYESAGVLEYVVVDVASKRVHWFERVGDFFRPLEPDDAGVLRSSVFPGLWLDAPALLERRPEAVAATLLRGLDSADHEAFAARS